MSMKARGDEPTVDEIITLEERADLSALSADERAIPQLAVGERELAQLASRRPRQHQH